jgi:hypothetical protein
MAKHTRSRLAPACVVAAVLLLAAAVAASEGEYVEIEGELYYAYGSNNEGGLPIHVTACSGASEGHYADGIDYSGDWIELAIDLPEAICYAASIRFQGPVGAEHALRLTMLDTGNGGPDLSAEFSFVGAGVG